jgi:membrane-associated phospholipid phosphatase
MQKTQDAIRAALGDIVEQNGPAEAALLGLMVAAGIFAVGWAQGHPTAKWWTVGAQTLGLSAAVAVIAVQVSHHGWLVNVDHSVTTWFVAHRNPRMDHIALAVTTALGPISTAAITAVVAAIVYARTRSLVCGLIVVATVGCASALCTGIKVLVGRARPPLAIQETLETDHSFPSGHVTGAAALFGIIAVLIGLSRNRSVQAALAVVVLLIVAAVALSRVYLGVHWLTDTVAGALLAAAVLTAGTPALSACLPDGFPAGKPRRPIRSRPSSNDALTSIDDGRPAVRSPDGERCRQPADLLSGGSAPTVEITGDPPASSAWLQLPVPMVGRCE